MLISAALVKQLRERTGTGMMECKKFLLAANGDIELAITEMRKAGQAKADKKSDRLAVEGVIIIAFSQKLKSAVMLEINSETDFVARDTIFVDFANKIAKTALHAPISTLPELLSQTVEQEDISDKISSQSLLNDTVDEKRLHLISKVGENIQIRRMVKIVNEEMIGTYLHGNRIGVIVSLKNGNESLAKDIAMHIAANRPMVINRQQLLPEIIEKEREIYTAQAKETGKPPVVVEKMIEGRIQKFMEDVSLLDQPFVKDPSIRVMELLKKHHAEVVSFYRFEVGEGIEKKENSCHESSL